MSRLIDRGVSWSGHERNVVYMNEGGLRFADASAASGGDFEDDGRAVVAVDLDFDGDEDLILRSRTSPSLRILRNDGGAGSNWIAFRPVGTGTNRGGIGATVTVGVEGRKIVRTLRSGEGYLACSGSWLTFGLGGAGEIESLEVRWPGGGAERPEPPAAINARYEIVEGGGLRRIEPPAVEPLRSGALPVDPSPRGGRILLRVPVPLPPTLRRALDLDGAERKAPVLVSLVSVHCPRCKAMWEEWKGAADRFHREGVEVRILLADQGEEDRAAAEAWARGILESAGGGGRFRFAPAGESVLDCVSVLLEHVTGRERGSLSTPLTLLAGPRGLELIALEPVAPEQAVADAVRWVRSPPHDAERGLEPGRWYFSSRRNWMGLAEAFRKAELHGDALFIQSEGFR